MANGLVAMVAEEVRRPGGELLAKKLDLGETTDTWEGPPTLSAAELLDCNFPDPTWIVPGLLPEGATLLAGRPKMGKSWLALGLALSVASGALALDKIEVEQGKVLYLALEDTARRLKKRLEMLLDGKPAPDDLHFATKWPRLDGDALPLLETWLEQHTGARFIIIDTLARIRAPEAQNTGLYAGDYAALSGLKTVADNHGIAIMVVHHLNKRAATEDPLDAVSGTTGLTGCADSIWILGRERGRADANLLVTGRDFEEQDVALEFDPNQGLWRFLGSADEYRRSSQRQEIIEVLKQAREPLRPKDISEALGKPSNNIRFLLSKLTEEGAIKNVGYGQYTIPTNTTNTANSSEVLAIK